MTTDLPRPPAHLSARSRKLWTAIVSRFQFEPEHLAMFVLGCEAIDRTDQARRRLAREGLTITGSRGAIQRHPLIDVEIQSRTAALRYFRELGLTEYVDDAKQGRTAKGRFA